MEIAFRPHHFLCATCFKGSGYSPAFIANFQTIMARLHAPQGHAIHIRVVSHTDSICSPCPHNQGLTCETEEKISILDQAHAQALAIHAGDLLTWDEARKRVSEKINLEIFHQICSTCSWKELGICESVVSNL